MSSVSIPSASIPLALRSSGRESTVQQAAGFGQILSADAVAKLEAKVAAALASHAAAAGNNAVAQRGGERVALRQPDPAVVRQGLDGSARQLTPEAMLIISAGQLMRTASEGGLEKMLQRLAGFRAQQAMRASQGERLAAALQAALADADAAEAALRSAAGEAESAQASAEAARDEAARVQAELDAMAPDDPARASKQAELAAARQQARAAEGRLEQAAAKLLDAGRQLDVALQQVDQQRREADVFNGVQPQLRLDTREDISASARLQTLIALLSRIMSDFSLDKLKNESEALMEQLRARQADNLERARKFEEEQQRARDAEKKTGCAGKIFGWIKAALGTIASVAVLAVGILTVNPAIIAGGVLGLALSVDYMVQLGTGFSVMGKLTEALGSLVSKALMAFGVDESTARMIGNVVATIAIMVAIVAAMIATGGTSGATGIVKLAEVGGLVMNVVAQVFGLAGQTAQNVGQLLVANIQIDMQKLLAAIEKSVFGSEVLRDMLEKLREAVASLDRGALDLMKQMGQVLAEDAATSRQVISHMRSA